ncbi:hypothetical protein OSTOST_17642 [Ostertagia ostertagi]
MLAAVDKGGSLQKVAFRKAKTSPKADSVQKVVSKSAVIRMGEMMKKTDPLREVSRTKSAESVQMVRKAGSKSAEIPKGALKSTERSPQSSMRSALSVGRVPSTSSPAKAQLHTAKERSSDKEQSPPVKEPPPRRARSPLVDDVATARERPSRTARSPSVAEVSTARERPSRTARSPSVAEVSTARERPSRTARSPSPVEVSTARERSLPTARSPSVDVVTAIERSPARSPLSSSSDRSLREMMPMEPRSIKESLTLDKTPVDISENLQAFLSRSCVFTCKTIFILQVQEKVHHCLLFEPFVQKNRLQAIINLFMLKLT